MTPTKVTLELVSSKVRILPGREGGKNLLERGNSV